MVEVARTLPATIRWRWALAALVAGGTAIAFSPIFVRLSELGPTATAFWRVALAVPPLWAWMAASPSAGTAGAGPARTGRLVLAGLLFAGDLAAWHWSLRYTSVANSTLFANMAPLFVTLGAWLVFGQRFTRTFLLGLALAVGGAAALMGGSLRLGPETLLGDLLGLVTALFYGSYILAVGRLRATVPAATVMAWSSLATAAALLPVTWLSGEAMLPVSAEGWLVLVGLAWFSHAGGQGLIAVALARLPAAFSAVTLLFQPVMSAVLAWLILGEPLGPAQALGGMLVLAGIALARRGTPS